MAMTVSFYSFSKRKNSTAIPSGSGTDFSVVLKAPTSYRSPSLFLEASGGFSYNYMVWSGWYYFVTDVISMGNDRYEVQCDLDVLGTLRSDILATSAFVLYDTTSNTELVDSRLSVKTTKTENSSSGAFQYLGGHSFPGGTIVAGLVTDDGASFYVMDGSVADDLLSNINQNEIPNLLPMPSISWGTSTLEDIVEGIALILDTALQNAITVVRHFLGSRNAADCIISAKQLPVAPGAITGTTEGMQLGTFYTGKTGKRITNRIVLDSADVSIPWTFSDWRRNSPYTELYLYIPFVGLIQLSPGDLIGEASIHIAASLDVISGDVIFDVSTGYGLGGPGVYIGQYSGNIAGEYAIGSSAVSIGQQAVTAIGAVGAGAAIVATGGAAAAMAAKIGAAGIAGIIASNSATPSSIHSGGGGAALGVAATCYCIEITHDTNVSPASVSPGIGTPAMEYKNLGSLTGFVQTRAASVSAPFYDSMIQEANNLLDGGVFIE